MPVPEIVATKVIVHPLVLLSVVDHFNRMGKTGNQKRVVGVLLGSWKGKGILDVSNSFAGINGHPYRYIIRIPSLKVILMAFFVCVFFVVPFDEDDKDKSVWFLDHDYLENMYGMFKKVNGKLFFFLETIVPPHVFYSSSLFNSSRENRWLVSHRSKIATK